MAVSKKNKTNRKSGEYLLQKGASESFKAYIPQALPPTPQLQMGDLAPLLEKSTQAMAELNSAAKSIPNPELFIYMYVRKEALLSSQIEGTQSSFSDLMLFEHHLKPSVTLADVEEVSNYVKAIQHGALRLKNGFPLSVRLLKEIHAKLLSGSRGKHCHPGEIRRSQNWIGGTRPGNALFVPPPVSHLAECLSNLEYFLHDNRLPTLIKAGIAHLQFETIHPFLDGNGRLGRLLITLMFCESEMLHSPILYLSLYLKNNKNTYYRLLQEVREHGTWEVWLEFFLIGIKETCQEATQKTLTINALFEKDLEKIATLKRQRLSAEKIFRYLQKMPQVSAPILTKELELSPPTIRNSLSRMADLNILTEITGKKRDKTYVYRAYLDLLQEGT